MQDDTTSSPGELPELPEGFLIDPAPERPVLPDSAEVLPEMPDEVLEVGGGSGLLPELPFGTFESPEPKGDQVLAELRRTWNDAVLLQEMQGTIAGSSDPEVRFYLEQVGSRILYLKASGSAPSKDSGETAGQLAFGREEVLQPESGRDVAEFPSAKASAPLVVDEPASAAHHPNGDQEEDGLLWRPVHVPSLPPAASPEDYKLHLAAVEWGLDPAILIQSAEDIQSRRHWSEIFAPFEHQVRNLITFCRRAPVALIADDVGLGKTISAGLVVSELMARGKIRRVLVMAPKLLLPQWKEELRKNFQINAEHGVGGDLTRLARSDVSAVITTYASARSRISALASSGFDMLIMDEAHKLRNLFPSAGAPQIAVKIRESLAARSFRYVLMLTATPIHNRLWDIYSLIDLLSVAKGHQNPLGPPQDFSRRFIADSSQVGRQLHLGRRDEFRRLLSQYMVRTRRSDCDLPFPQRHVRMIRAKGHPAEKDLISLVAKEIKDLNPLAKVSLAQALMSSPQALLKQLEGTGKLSFLAEARRVATRIERTGKEELLLGLVEQLQHERPSEWRVVVFTGRLATQEAIGRLLRTRFGEQTVGLIRGNQAESNQRCIEDYSQSPPKVHVIVSTDAGAEGVNLQAGNVVVNYDLPWNPMILEQRIGRVQRLASMHAKVSVLNLVLAGSVEERVVGRLTEKLSTIAATLGDIEGILESLGEDEESLEREIQRMVLASLEGQDVEASVQRIQASVDKAKSIYEEEKRSVEDSLGRLDAMHEDGPRMPKLTEVEPRLTEEDFTLAALRREGGELRENGNGTFVHARPGRVPELVVFDEKQRPSETAFFGGPAVQVFRSGQPAFERLVGRWVARAGLDLGEAGRGEAADPQVRACVDLWSKKFGGLEVLAHRGSLGQASFRGTVAVRVACSVAHDKYEKLVEVPVENQEAVADATNPKTVGGGSENPSAPELARALESRVRSALGVDPDVTAFGKFYLERMEEEMARAGGDGRLAELARNSFRPEVAAEIAGISGTRQWTARVQVEYSIDGLGRYTSNLECDPSAGILVHQPEEDTCEVTGRRLPGDAVGACSISGKRALLHLLVRSEKSDRQALAEHVVTCAMTGRALLSDEAGRCHVRGLLVDRSLLEQSEVSGRTALREEMSTCSFTGVRALPDELETSEVSGQRYRSDQGRVGEGRPVRGHQSEFQRCQETGNWLLGEELAESSVSMKRVRRDLLRASEKSGRFGLPAEGGRCAVTGRFLLEDEMGVCEISGKRVGRELLVTSEASGRHGLEAHSRHCQQSGACLLDDEVGRCCVTGKIVDARLLEASEASGLAALKEALVPCGETGKRVLPQELGTCEVTGLKVVAEHLHSCSVTGKRACERVLVKSALSGKWLLKDEAVQAGDGGAYCLPSEAVRCVWDQALHMPQDVGTCAWTGARIARKHLDPTEVLLPLRDLLQGREGGEAVPPTVAEFLRRFPELRKLGDVHGRTGPGGRSMAVIGTLSGFLGLHSRRIGLLVRLEPELQREGVEVIGRGRGQSWTPEIKR